MVKTTISLIAVIIVTAALSGCNQPLERSETIEPTAGYAVRANIQRQIVDPSPSSSQNTTILTDGEVARRAFEDYQTGKNQRPNTGPSIEIRRPGAL